MPELTIISTFENDFENPGKPVVRTGMSECPQLNSQRFVYGPDLSSEIEIDKRIDGIIKQLELARIEAKAFLIKTACE